ncbi:MAG TPA: hemolysin family protein [Anaerolineales bacterium]|nr:hemolysin family protein [Anaerolineales bacterium]
MMIDPVVAALLLLIAFVIAWLLAAARSALVNTQVSTLMQLQSEGAMGAGRAIDAAFKTTRLILSVRIALGALRLLGVGVGIGAFAGNLSDSVGSPLAGGGLVLLAVGLLIGLTEFHAENLVLRDPSRWAVRLAPLAELCMSLTSPLVGPVSWLGVRLAPDSDRRRNALVTEEEIKTLVEAGEVGGVIERDEKAMIYSIFKLGDTLAREVMVPRIDMLAFEEATGLDEATDGLLQTGYSRAPAYAGTVDNIVGLLYVKDLLATWRKGDQVQTIKSILRPAYFVPEAKRVDDLLAEMQARRVQMAIVVDEYGGTAGLVTIEDIVEEIVGEIRDEYDVAEELPYRQLKDGEFMFNGGIDLDDVNQIASASLPKDTSETLGGFIYSQLGRVPTPGDVIETGSLRLIVEQVHGRRIRKVRAHRLEEQAAEKPVERNHRTAAN